MRNYFAAFIFAGLLMFASQAGAQGSINNSLIGLTTPQAGKFTNLEATTQITLGADTVTDLDDLDDKNVKVSTNDTTPGFLNGKLVQGSGITLVESNDGANETLIISSPATLTAKGDVLYHNGTSETRLPVGASGQYLTSDTNDNLLWANPPEGDQLFNSNVLLNTYRIAENGSLPALKIIDGTVDAFTNESGVDTTASTNEVFDSSNDYYKPADDGTGPTIPFTKFGGSDDYLTISESSLGLSDGKNFLFSVWFRLDSSGDNISNVFFANDKFINSTVPFIISNDNDKKTLVVLNNSAGTQIAVCKGNTVLTSADGLVHLLVGIDLDNTTQADRVKMVVNDVEETVSCTKGPDNDTVNSAQDDFLIGASHANSLVYDFQGEMAQFYLAEEVLDISLESNRRKFIDERGDPVDLGSDGSIPTGNQPRIFLKNSVSTFQTNLGSGGNFTKVGTFTAGTDAVIPGDLENMTLISSSQTAKTEPNGANILLLAEDINANIVINTDIKASVSRDGGTTFTQVTLSDAGEFEKGNLLTGTVDLSSQPTGTDMEWKVETNNNKDLNLHGVGLEWR